MRRAAAVLVSLLLVAAAGLQGLERGKRVVVPGMPNRILAVVGRFSPRPVVLRVMDSS